MSPWRQYWFPQAPCLDLAVVRVVAVVTQLFWMLAYARVWDVFELRAALPDETWQPLIILNVMNALWGWGFRPTLETLQTVYYVGLVAGLFSLVGLATNVALLVFATACVYMHAFIYSFGDFHHPEAVMMIALFALALSPSGRALSLDAWLGRRRRRQAGGEVGSVLDRTSEFAAWPLKLLQWFFVLMYASAVWNKLGASGLDWANGYTLQYVLARDGLRWDVPLGYWLSHQHVLVLLTQYAVLLFQASFALAVIFPKLRWVYVPVGLGFHIAIFLTLRAPFFQWIALYAVFIPWTEAWRLYAARSGGRSAQPAARVG